MSYPSDSCSSPYPSSTTGETYAVRVGGLTVLIEDQDIQITNGQKVVSTWLDVKNLRLLVDELDVVTKKLEKVSNERLAQNGCRCGCR